MRSPAALSTRPEGRPTGSPATCTSTRSPQPHRRRGSPRTWSTSCRAPVPIGIATPEPDGLRHRRHRPVPAARRPPLRSFARATASSSRPTRNTGTAPPQPPHGPPRPQGPTPTTTSSTGSTQSPTRNTNPPHPSSVATCAARPTSLRRGGRRGFTTAGGDAGLEYTLRRCHSTVWGLRNNLAPMSVLVKSPLNERSASLSSQGGGSRDGTFAHFRSDGLQCAAGPFGECVGPELGQHLVGDVQLRTSVDAAVLSA